MRKYDIFISYRREGGSTSVTATAKLTTIATSKNLILWIT